MKKPTIYEIKAATQEKSPLYFDRKTMKCFGQTMKSFTVHKSPKGNIYIYAATYDRDGKMMGFSFRQFVDNSLKGISGLACPTITKILDYIENN